MNALSRFTLWLTALGLVMALACSFARAAESKFTLSVQADGVSLGTAKATLTVTAASPGVISWRLSDGVFTPLPNPDGKLKWNDAILAGSGQTKAADAVAIKEFDITVEQSTGVDVTFRFRLSATMADSAVKSVAIEQVK